MRQGWYTTEECEVAIAETEASLRLPNGYSLMTQTCDLSRQREAVQIVAHVHLTDEQVRQFGGGKSPRYHLVTGNIFADFDRVWTIKVESINEARLVEIPLNVEKAFRDAAGRNFGRLAVPTHVGHALAKLQKYLKEKSKNPETQAGTMVTKIREIRISMEPDWAEESDKESVGLTLILDDDEFSVIEDWASTEGTDALSATLEALCDQHNASQSLTSLAAHLNSSPPGTPEREIVWQKIAQQFARICRDGVSASIPKLARLSVEISSKSQFTMNDMESSERLDLAHLSSEEF